MELQRALSGQETEEFQPLVRDVRSLVERLARERDTLQARVERMEARVAKAGLEIHWGDTAQPPSPRPAKKAPKRRRSP